MKATYLTCIAHFFLVVALQAGPETREKYAEVADPLHARLETFSGEGDFSKEEIRALMTRLEEQWNTLLPEDKDFYAPRNWHDNRAAAALLAALGDDAGASEFLRKQVLFTRQYGMSPAGGDSKFDQFVLVQAQVAERTGSDPLANMVDYLFRKEGATYIAAQQESEPEVHGITISGIGESEALARVLYLIALNGKVMIERTRWVIGPKGPLEETLRRATREVLQEQDGRVSAKSLSTPVFASESKSQKPFPEQLPAAAVSTVVTPAPTTTRSTASTALSSTVTPTASTATSPTEKRTSVWPWVVGTIAVGILIIAILKARK